MQRPNASTAASSPSRRPTPLAGADRVWLQDSPANLMVIHAVFTLDRIDVETLRELWSEKVLRAGGGERYPRFTRRVARTGGRAFWQPDPDFDLARHIFEVEGADGEDLSTTPGLEAYVGRLASRPLPADRPPWEIRLVPRFGDGGSAAIVRIHHVMGDGVALVPILFSLMDTAPEGGGLVMPAVIDRGGKPPNKTLLALRAALAGPVLLGRKLLWRRDRSPLHGPPLSGTKRVAWTRPIPVDLVKTIKNRYGATVNDVLVACVAGAFERHVAERGGSLEQLRASMPINVRSRSEALEMNNKFAAVLLSLPVGSDDVEDRIRRTKESMDVLKGSIEPYFTYGVVNVLLKVLPPAWSRALIDYLADKCTLVLSNVPGPRVPVYLAGRRLRAMLFWVPQRAGIGIGVSILSFAGELRVGVLADVAVVPDPEDLVRAFEQELEELRRRVETAASADGPAAAQPPAAAAAVSTSG